MIKSTCLALAALLVVTTGTIQPAYAGCAEEIAKVQKEMTAATLGQGNNTKPN
jgi:hypothetical protein